MRIGSGSGGDIGHPGTFARRARRLQNFLSPPDGRKTRRVRRGAVCAGLFAVAVPGKLPAFRPTKPRPLLVAAFAAVATALAAAAPATLHDAVARFHAATAENLPAAYRAAFADDGILMFLHARGRAELDAALASRISPTAKFAATPVEEIEAASHDLGFVRGDYRLDFTRRRSGEHITANGRFVEL